MDDYVMVPREPTQAMLAAAVDSVCGYVVGGAAYRMVGDVYELMLAAAPQQQAEPVALQCCGYTDSSAVKWNPGNKVVQCHNCGAVYSPRITIAQVEQIKRLADQMADAAGSAASAYTNEVVKKFGDEEDRIRADLHAALDALKGE